MAPVVGLAGHATYACRHSGACCTSGWPIPVEPPLLPVIEQALAAKRVQATASPAIAIPPGLPPGIAAILGREGPRCTFHDTAVGCRLHAALGPGGKPGSCRQFPWTAVHDPRGTFVSLSHYCPSAAALLHEPTPLTLVPLDPIDATVEGIDVRDALPPALDAARLMDWDGVTAWTRQALACCERADGLPDLIRQFRALERRAVAWDGRATSLAAWLDTWPPPGSADTAAVPGLAWTLDTRVRDAVPAGLEVRQAPDWTAALWTGGLERALAAHVKTVGRYVAARLVVCWPLHLGRGLATATRYVEALIVLLAGEIARRRREPQAPVARASLTAAIRDVDLLVLHLCDPRALADALDDEDDGA